MCLCICPSIRHFVHQIQFLRNDSQEFLQIIHQYQVWSRNDGYHPEMLIESIITDIQTLQQNNKNPILYHGQLAANICSYNLTCSLLVIEAGQLLHYTANEVHQHLFDILCQQKMLQYILYLTCWRGYLQPNVCLFSAIIGINI